MDDLKIFQKFRKIAAHGIIYSNGAETSADHEDHWLFGSKTSKAPCLFSIPFKKFLTDRGSCQNCLVGGKKFHCLREIAAHLHCGRNGKFVGKSGCHIRLMDDDRHFTLLSCHNHWNRHKSSFGEDHIRFEKLDQLLRFAKAFQHPEGICKVLDTEIAAQFSGGYPVIGDPELLDQLLLDSVIGADVVNIIL